MSDDLCGLRKGGKSCDVVKTCILREGEGIWEVEEALIDVSEGHIDGDARKLGTILVTGGRASCRESYVLVDNVLW